VYKSILDRENDQLPAFGEERGPRDALASAWPVLRQHLAVFAGGSFVASGSDACAFATDAVGVQGADPADDRVEILLRQGSDLQVVDFDQIVLGGRTNSIAVDSLVAHLFSFQPPGDGRGGFLASRERPVFTVRREPGMDTSALPPKRNTTVME
jgi:hypothetical protein